jgi:prepilin-type N-terminal cleavage/methylation domain-containing protein
MLRNHRQKGYSLVELLMVLAILGIALAIALPALGIYMRSYSARVGTDEFVSRMRLVRHLAIARHQPVSITVNADDYSVPDWNDADIATADTRDFELPGGVSVVSGTGTMTFRSDGTCSTGATTVRLEIAMNGEITARYDVAVSAAGKIKTTYTKVTS